jgi:hypothetical protein
MMKFRVSSLSDYCAKQMHETVMKMHVYPIIYLFLLVRYPNSGGTFLETGALEKNGSKLSTVVENFPAPRGCEQRRGDYHDGS